LNNPEQETLLEKAMTSLEKVAPLVDGWISEAFSQASPHELPDREAFFNILASNPEYKDRFDAVVLKIK